MADGDRYSNMGGVAAFGFLANALGGGGDRGQVFPQSDAEDMSCGARFIPDNVTLARREGETVVFTRSCSRNCWYWELPDGSREYHWDPDVYEEIGRHNNGVGWTRESNVPAGPCYQCGNPHTNGGHVTAEEAAAS